MIIPIFVCLDDIPELDFDGFGEFFIAYLIACVGSIPLTYSIIGCINGFNVWGLYGVSIIIGLLVGIMVVMISDFILEY